MLNTTSVVPVFFVRILIILMIFCDFMGLLDIMLGTNPFDTAI
jgi:hypothetical protein